MRLLASQRRGRGRARLELSAAHAHPLLAACPSPTFHFQLGCYGSFFPLDGLPPLPALRALGVALPSMASSVRLRVPDLLSKVGLRGSCAEPRVPSCSRPVRPAAAPHAAARCCGHASSPGTQRTPAHTHLPAGLPAPRARQLPALTHLFIPAHAIDEPTLGKHTAEHRRGWHAAEPRAARHCSALSGHLASGPVPRLPRLAPNQESPRGQGRAMLPAACCCQPAFAGDRYKLLLLPSSPQQLRGELAALASRRVRFFVCDTQE